MPQQAPLRQRLTVELADRQQGAKTYKQKAVRTGFSYQQAENGEVSIVIELIIQAFEPAADGRYGRYLGLSTVPDRRDQLLAANDTVVEAASGRVLAEQGTLSEEFWRDKVNGYAQLVSLQGDYFERLAASGSVDIDGLCRQYIQLANQLRRWQ